MKSKQSLFQEIISVSSRKVRERSTAAAKDQFQLRLKNIPKIKQLNACPYMFIFDMLIAFPQQVDFVLTQYQKMIEQSFLNPQPNSKMLAQHFKNNLNNHSFRIIQIMMQIKDPNLQFMELFFQIHNTVAMPENVLESFRFTGYRWLSRAFGFKQCPRPLYIDGLTSGILKVQDRNLPTIQDQQRSRAKYIQKILSNITINIQNTLKPQNQRVQSKQGFCLMCQKPADYYCKDTKIPVCSPACKKAHANFLTNNPCLDFQYTQIFKQQIQKLLFTNLKRKKNVSLSIDYLCSIYINSQFTPRQPLPHKQLLTVPIIAQRIWILYTMYYLRRNQIFEHIYADCLKSKIDYICINSAKYFLKIVETHHIIQVFQFLDCHGYRRIMPIILANLHDQQYKLKFIYSLIDRIYESQQSKNIAAIGNQIQKLSTRQSTLLRAVNYEKNPIKNFKQIYGQNDALRQMIKFIIKNQQQVNKNKICDIIFADDATCIAFLQELFIQKHEILQNSQKKMKKRMKSSPFADQILRQIFYFLNIKISDKIYHLLQLLDQVLNPKQLQPSKQQSWSENQLHVVFGPDNTSTQNTMFQFFYLILMIVTELNQFNQKNGARKKVTQAQFLTRVKNFDSKFANNKKDYIIGVYNRLNEQPFSQQTRGVLMKYPTVKRIRQQKNTFHPVRILLDNWQTIFQCLSNAKNQAILLYRCCSSLTKFPTICQPFFQLLLRKLTNQQPNQPSHKNPHRKASETIQRQQNLLLYINNILQFQPNCIGHSSWQYLFLRDPNPKYSSHIYLFQLSSLIYHSNLLTLSNFIWFVKYFCSAIKISQNMQQCLKLVSNNYKKHDESSSNTYKQTQEQKTRIKIIQKEYVTLFMNQKNVYFQLQFMKGIFQIGFFELAITFLDVLEINIVSQPLIMSAIVDVIQANWQAIEAYRAQIQDKSIKATEQQLIPTQVNKSTQQNIMIKANSVTQNKNLNTQISIISNKIWTHLLNKSITIGIQKPYLLAQLAQYLYSIPQLHPYFEHLIIQHAIQSAMQGKLIIIDPLLTKKLGKFQQHIMQMHNAKYSIMQRGGDVSGKALLDQFVNQQNMQCIILHFKYFWQIQQVYTILTDLIIYKIKHLINPNSESILPNANLNTKSYSYILKVLEENNYINLIKVQNRLQTIIGFISVLIKLLQLEIHIYSNSEGRNMQDKGQSQGILQVLNTYTKQLQIIVKEIILSNINQKIIKQLLQNSQAASQDQQQPASNPKQRSFYHFSYIYNIISAYLTPLHISSVQTQLGYANKQPQKQQKRVKRIYQLLQFSSVYGLEEVLESIVQINSDLKYRLTIYQAYTKIYQHPQNSEQEPHVLVSGLFKLPPGLLQQQFMASLLNIFYYSDKKKHDFVCNWDILIKFLEDNLPIFKKLIELIHKPKPKKQKILHSQTLPQANIPSESVPSTASSTSLQYKPSSNTTLTKQKTVEQNRTSTPQMSSSQQSLQHEQLYYQQQLCNQKISYVKKTLTQIYSILRLRIDKDTQKDTKPLQKINNILVQYIYLGFDYYNPTKKQVQFTHAHHHNPKKDHHHGQTEHNLLFKIYQVLNNPSHKLI